MKTNNFEMAVRLCGGVKRIAEYFEITEWAVRKWEKQIPAKRCKGLIELSNGKLTFVDLRPDLFD